MGWRLGAIALLALLVRAIVPAGFMLTAAETEDGRYLTVTFCSEHPGTPQVIDLATGKIVDGKAPADGQKHDAGNEPCVFAVAAHAPAPVAGIPLDIRFAASADETVRIETGIRPGRGIAAPPPPSTGPPSLI